MIRKSSLILPFLIMILIIGCGLLLMNYLPFYSDVKNITVLLTFTDVFITYFVFYFFFRCHKSLGEKLVSYFVKLSEFLSRTLWFWLLVLIGMLVFSYERFELILSGIGREDLISEYGRNRYMMFFSPITLLLCSLSWVLNYRLGLKVVFTLSLVLSVFYTLSRSDILNFIYLSIVVWSICGLKFSESKQIIFLFLAMFFLSSVITILQGRTDQVTSAVINMSEALVKYNLFSMYLSEIVVEKMGDDYEKILFPFFGFFSERFLSIFFELTNPISVQGSTFISDFVLLGHATSLAANVNYPWWSWFYALYGPVGLVIKAVYMYALLLLFYKFRLYITFTFFCYLLVFVQFRRHILINNDAVYFFLGIFLFEIVFKICTNISIVAKKK